MPLETTSNSAVESLTLNQLLHWGDGDAWESGCNVTIADSDEDIVINVSAGSVYVGDTENPVTVNAQQKLLQTAHPEKPRKDVVVVDENGTVDVNAGSPAEIKSDLNPSNRGFDPVYHAYRPAPDELDGKGGEEVAIAVVWVPPDAVSSNDLDEDITYVMDRRLSNPANAVTPELIDAIRDADDAVLARHLADGAVDSAAKLADSIVTAAKVADDVATQAELDGLTFSDVGAIEDGTDTVDASNLATDAVDTDAVVDAAVTGAKLADTSVTRAKVADDAVGPDQLDETGAYDVESLSADDVAIGPNDEIITAEGTSDIASLNSQIASANADGMIHLFGQFDVGATHIELPSNTTLVNWGTLRQADGTAGSNVRILTNQDTSNGTDENITFINHGVIDGNCSNQTDQDATRYAIQFVGVTNLEFHGVHVIDPVDFCMSVNACETVRFSDFTAEVNTPESHQDGLHFYDTNNVIGHGVSGTSEDDLLIIGISSADTVSGYSITGVEGTSINANLVKFHRANDVLGSGAAKTLENITVTGIGAQSPGASGIHFGPYDGNTTFRNISVEGVVDAPTEHGVNMSPGPGSDGATFEQCSVDLSIYSPGLEGVMALGPGAFKNGELKARVSNLGGANAPIRVGSFYDSAIELRAEFDGDPPSLNMTDSDNVTVDVSLNGGGRGVQFGSSSTAVTNSIVRGTSRNIAGDDFIEVSGGGSDNNRVELHGPTPVWANTIAGNTTTVNGTGTEDLGTSPTSAPTGSWPDGTTVRNSNSDNNETWRRVARTWVQIA